MSRLTTRQSLWDMVYALDMAIACVISYWLITHALQPLSDRDSDLLGGMWAVNRPPSPRKLITSTPPAVKLSTMGRSFPALGHRITGRSAPPVNRASSIIVQLSR